MPSVDKVARSKSDDPMMDMLKTLILIVASISFLVFVALFGRLPVFRKTPVGWCYRLLMVYLPNALVGLDEKLTGRRITRTTTRVYNYLMYDRHPVVLIIFVLLQLGSELLFLPPAWTYIPSNVQRYLVLPVLITLPYSTLYLSYSTSSHHITPESYPQALTRYPYDYTLYHPHRMCRTCHYPKPARSKHCPICKACIERQDHHCIWINNCVGLHNYHYFIALLVTVAALLGYGALTGFGILEKILQEMFVPRRLTAGSLTNKRWSTGLSWMEYFNAYTVCLATNARIGAVTLLASMTCPLALGFLVYHAYLIWAGTTTNETAKWSDLREDIQDDLVWQARIDDVKTEYPGPLDEKIVYDSRNFRDATSRSGQVPSWGYGRKAHWWIIRTRGGVNPTRWKPLEGQYESSGRQKVEEVIDERWKRVKSLDEIDNLYDLGLVGNFKDGLLRPWRDV
ncbi:palmitoyltransferase swf1 [Lithohypha guttulata]|uniref:palmitoyltransferase swf1 n=1 Tax=Lithohypha guttulata TaxID=1690604 RepID=UPI002DDF92A7|nr:palmitoyltransferase swf1 [Lithohypha guttulata]